MIDRQKQQLLISVSSQRSSNGVFFYNALFDLLKIDANYLGIQTQSLRGFRESFSFLSLHAASIAAPFKTAVVPLLDTLSESSNATGSVNSVRNRNGALEGHNTDFAGARTLLLDTWNPNEAPRVLIYGTGGVVPSIVAAIRELRPHAQIGLHGRNVVAGRAICQKLHVQWQDKLHQSSTDLWVNATPASISNPGELVNLCRNATTIFDLVASQSESPFEVTIRNRGQQFIRGFDFYRAQFLEQFFFYFNHRIDPAVFDSLAAQRLPTK